jgi:hypothetical protein
VLESASSLSRVPNRFTKGFDNDGGGFSGDEMVSIPTCRLGCPLGSYAAFGVAPVIDAIAGARVMREFVGMDPKRVEQGSGTL